MVTNRPCHPWRTTRRSWKVFKPLTVNIWIIHWFSQKKAGFGLLSRQYRSMQHNAGQKTFGRFQNCIFCNRHISCFQEIPLRFLQYGDRWAHATSCVTTGTIVFFTFQTIVTSNFHVLKKNSRFMKSCSMSAVFVHLQGHSWHSFEQIYSLTSSPPSLETWSCWVLAGWRPAWEMFSKQLFFPEYFCSFVFTLSPWVSLVHGLSAARS